MDKIKKKIRQNSNGITLIALVITIIVLLILAAVSIATLTGDNGILSKTEEAKKRTEIADLIERVRIDILNVQVENNSNITKKQFIEILQKYFELNTIPSENNLPDNLKEATQKVIAKEEYGKYEIAIVDIWDGNFIYIKPDTDITKIGLGDYVAYNPTKVDVEGKQAVDSGLLSYESLKGSATEHGNGSGTQNFTATGDTKWKILNVEADGTIELVSENPIKTSDTNKSFVLYGAVGYLYAEQELHEICKIFGYGYGANPDKGGTYTIGGPNDTPITKRIENTGARSIIVEDINKLAKVGKTVNNTTVNKSFNEFNEKYGTINLSDKNIYYPSMELNRANEDGASKEAGAKGIEATWYLYYNTEISDELKIKNTLFNGWYWLASRFNDPNSTDYGNHFGVRYIKEANRVSGFSLCYGDENEITFRSENDDYFVRPVVTLKPNVVDTSGEYEEEVGWKLK